MTRSFHGTESPPNPERFIHRTPVLGGLINEYQIAI